ncbi:LysR family transcriptional regulator [Chitinophaga sp. Hz27]|uniref:LysR family transcriptional regulator n=1 Tax=Chitinophaga sp. Hz27 TaxID=3347169 RepID=UPI0035D8EEF1
MELRQLKYFVKAAEIGNFTAAAKELFVTQSTLSQQIMSLEAELNTHLFDRVGKKVLLTEGGQILLEHARYVLEEVEKSRQAIDELQGLLTGELRIGVTYAFTSMLLPLLVSFPQKYPGIRLRIVYASPNELERKLRDQELDMLLTFHSKDHEEGLEMRPLLKSRIVMAVSKKHPMAGKKSVGIKSLKGMEMILATPGYSSRDFLDEILKKHEVNLSVKIEMNDVHSLLSLVEKGHWATLLNERAVTGWKNIVVIPLEGQDWVRKSYVITLKGIRLKKSAARFIQELEKVTAELK